MIYLMDGQTMEYLPFELRLIVYKYLHQAKWDRVCQDYHSSIGKYWDEHSERFEDNCRYRCPFLMYRNFREGHWYENGPSITCIFTIRDDHPFSRQRLPSNY